MSDHEGPWGRPPAPPPAKTWRTDRRLRLIIILAIAGVVAVVAALVAQAYPFRVGSGQDWAWMSVRLGWAALLCASLFSMRLKLKDAVRGVLIWTTIVLALALGYTFRDDFIQVGTRLRAELIPGEGVVSGAHEMVLTQGVNGDFFALGQVNGQPVRFVVDTGASDIVLAPQDAQRLGVNVAGLDYTGAYETANGTGQGAPFTATSLSVGPIKFATVPMVINQAPMSQSLLGMAFLKRLDSFEVKDGRLVLRWRG